MHILMEVNEVSFLNTAVFLPYPLKPQITVWIWPGFFTLADAVSCDQHAFIGILCQGSEHGAEYLLLRFQHVSQPDTGNQLRVCKVSGNLRVLARFNGMEHMLHAFGVTLESRMPGHVCLQLPDHGLRVSGGQQRQLRRSAAAYLPPAVPCDMLCSPHGTYLR